METSVRKTYALLVLTMAAWGGTFVAGRLVSFEVAPFTAAFWRFTLALAVLAPLTLKKEKTLLPKGLSPSKWLILFLLGATGMLGYNYLFIKGLTTVQAGRASVIVAMNPSLTFLGTVIFFGEKLSAVRLAGFACALSGAAVTITHGRFWEVFQGQVGSGEFLMFGCVFCWVTYSLLGKVILGSLSPLMATTWACLTGVMLLLPAALWESGPAAFLEFSLRSWTCLAFLGILGTSLGFTLFYQGIVRLGAGRAAIFINLVPVFGIIFGGLFLGEKLDLPLILGLILVLTGIRLIQRV